MLASFLKRRMKQVLGLDSGPIPVPALADCRFAHEYLVALQQRISGPGGLRRHYTWGVLRAAFMARELGLKRVSVIEFGVAGGGGLCALDELPDRIRPYIDVDIEIVGFDSGVGLPPPQDYRDLPNLWSAGDYAMDHAALQRRLKHARLILGPVEETVGTFLQSDAAPVGFIAFDLDYYSSTVAAFRLLEAEPERLLPRVYCYFDDIIGFTFGDLNGERLAIHEFNAKQRDRQISPIYGLRYELPRRYFFDEWTEKMFLAHCIDHPRYNAPDGLVRPNQQRPLG
jgi:hypothetical protein